MRSPLLPVTTQMAAAANRSRLVDGKLTSLADLGFSDIGLDVSGAHAVDLHDVLCGTGSVLSFS